MWQARSGVGIGTCGDRVVVQNTLAESFDVESSNKIPGYLYFYYLIWAPDFWVLGYL